MSFFACDDVGFSSPSVERSNQGRPTTCRYCGHAFHVKDHVTWEEEKHPCPSCAEIWSDKPETERMLMILQDEYLEVRPSNQKKADKILSEMFKLMFSYCESLFKKNFSNAIQQPGKLEEVTQWAVSRLTEEFLKRPDFKVNGSFKGMLFPKMQEALYGKQEKPTPKGVYQESLDFEFEDGHAVIYEDHKKSIADSMRQRHDKEFLVNNICDLIFGIKDYCTAEEDFIRLLNIRNYIIGGEKYTDAFFNLYDKTGKEKFLDTLTILKQDLKQKELDNY
jgi:Zn-finger nucleic acid-binding protein